MITASALAPHCAYAKVLGRDKPRTPDQQRDIDRGTEFHRLREQMVKEQRPLVVEDDELQGWLDVWLDRFGWMLDGARPVHCEVPWGLLEDGEYIYVEEPEPHVYVAHQRGKRRLITAGRADVDWMTIDGIVCVVDDKTGRWPVADAAVNLQVNGAGLALAQKYAARGYIPAVYYARDGHLDEGEPVMRGTPEWDRQWEAVRDAANLPLEPRPGPWCSTCWSRKSCPANQ